MVSVGPAAATSAGPVSYVEWGAVFAGAVLAAAISFVLLTFGAAIGLSATSPWPNSGMSAKVVASMAIFWAMAQQIGAFLVGGYVAGRMRSRWAETGDEADFRDGLHGGLVWAVGVAIGALIFFSTAGAVARTGVEVAGQAAATAASSNDPLGSVVDTLLRPANLAQAAPATPPAAAATTPAAPAARARPAAGQAPADDQRAEIGRLLATATTSASMSAQDRAYLAQLVAQRTGLSQQEAERRVTEAITAAREAADKTRRAAVLTGFVTAAALLISFAAAWWAALKGGNHRDGAVPARFDFTTRRRTQLPS
jgi:hypothetical protein